MSISNTTNKVIYQGDGSTTEFPFSFRIFDETDLVVSLYEIATGIETELTLNSDYTVTINGDNGGTVIMVTAPSSSHKLIIKRILPLTQETDYVEGDPFPAESHERALDKLTMITQQLNEQLDRTVKVDITQTSVNTTLPIPDALKFLRWNSDASKLENASGITSTEYPSNISLGLDANKSTNPAEGDIYIATDSQKIYVCHSTGTWTEYKVNILSGIDTNKPTTYKQNRFYWATDTKKLYWDNGSSWTDISAQFSVNNADKVDNKDASDFFQKAEIGEINALTEKTSPVDDDIVLIEDSEDSYAKKKVKRNKLVNSWQIVGSVSPSGATSITFNNLSPNKQYAIEYNLSQNTIAGDLYLRFNNDSGNNYWWVISLATHNGGYGAVGNATSYIRVVRDTMAGFPLLGFFRFSAVPTNPSAVFLHGESSHWRWDGYLEINIAGGRYAGSSNLSSITIETSAGNFTGKVYLLELKE